MPDLNVEQIQQLIDEGRKVQREQDQIAGALEEKQKAVTELEAKIEKELDVKPADLPKAIEQAQAELHNMAVEFGLIEGDAVKVPKAPPITVDVVSKDDPSRTGQFEKQVEDDGLVDFPPSDEDMKPAETPDLGEMFGDI